MTVRHSLLAILTAGDAYGYQLRQEFNRRTDSVWPLNVGQVYTTLDRLERDGLVEQREADADGHVRYRITDAGAAEVERWFASPVLRTERDELAVKMALASTLAVGVDPVIAAQRSLPQPAATGAVGTWLAALAEAEALWLASVAEARHTPVPLSDHVPKRGRPSASL